MGMYTEIIIGCRLKRDTPEEVIESLQELLKIDDEGTEDYNFPEHEFFKSERFRWMFFSASYYFGTPPHRVLERDSLDEAWQFSTRSNLKNYDNEIQKFIDWIKPYVEDGSGQNDIFAMSMYEESEEFTVYQTRRSG